MNKRIQKAIFHIESHLYDDLDISQLAEISAYSKFHFCRAFRAQMGESVMAYTHRLRLEGSSQEVGIGRKAMIDVALDVGFQTPTGFLKAFKKHFGMTPTDYKRKTKKKIKAYEDIEMETPEIVNRETTHVVFSRALGDYFKSSDIAWDRLTIDLNKIEDKYKNVPQEDENAFDMQRAELMGIYYDDPDVTAEEKIRYDACIAWTKEEIDFLNSEGLQTKIIPSGKYVKVLHKGSYESSDDSWYGLYAWIEKNNIELRDEPSFAKYINNLDEVTPSELLTEIYVPIA